MFYFSAVLLTLFGAILIYLTNRHQMLINSELPKPVRQVGYSLFVMALLSWLQVLTTAAAVFTWLFTCITLLTLMPFFSLIIKGKQS
ncbi:hypothetical protein [Shewanella sp. UCD-KL12]|uniref:hypothetical protein n=1 Tax=Shewanella sp. UCD-KL12 TaxID=1917163 RepID=UPI0009703B07|nr:hypothetical protein [Shewanella sp. UCD-KL12]